MQCGGSRCSKRASLDNISFRPSADFLDNRPAFTDYWRKRISVCLQKQNAEIILRRVKAIHPEASYDITPQLPLTPIFGALVLAGSRLFMRDIFMF
eukprot:m.202348 g.202348  ORF g.202348 m.202348 type:complete len:96 (+) comp39611_c0_seq3:258-545(+)